MHGLAAAPLGGLSAAAVVGDGIPDPGALTLTTVPSGTLTITTAATSTLTVTRTP